MTQMAHPDISGLTYQRDLGSGGFADVYLYHRQTPDRLVAIKVLRATNLSDDLTKRFTAEANAMAAITHPHIAQVYSAGATIDGRPYIEMAYYPYGSLQDQIQQTIPSVPDVLRIGVQLCSAVETAHQLTPPLLHRDIKPANVLIDQYGDPALTDFGIASRITDQNQNNNLSVYWAAPEVMFARSQIDKRADIYSLAALLWHLLAGHAPFVVLGGDNRTNTTMIRTRDLPVPAIGRPDVPASLERLLDSTMSKDPRFRPSSAADLARALQAIEQQEYGFARVTPFKVKVEQAPQVAGRGAATQAGVGYERTRLKSSLQTQPPSTSLSSATVSGQTSQVEPQASTPTSVNPQTSAPVVLTGPTASVLAAEPARIAQDLPETRTTLKTALDDTLAGDQLFATAAKQQRRNRLIVAGIAVLAVLVVVIILVAVL